MQSSFSGLNGLRGFCLTIIAVGFLLLIDLYSRNPDVSLTFSTSAPAAIVQRAIQVPARKVAVAFGNEARETSGYAKLSSPSHFNAKRALTYDEAVKKGKCHVGRINGKGLPSQYTELSDMVENNGGWTILDEGSQDFPTELKTAFEGLGLEGGYRTPNVMQNQEFHNDIKPDIENLPTYGTYSNQYSVDKKTIIALNSFSPTYELQEARKPAAEENLPRVSAWSDVAWIQWRNLAGSAAAAGALQYVVRYKIITAETRYIIEQVTRSQPNGFNSPWPGQEFKMSTDQGKALLGTPHGGGVAWLIVNHRGNIPLKKKITKVNVFTEGSNDAGPYYHMIWTIA